MVRSARAARVGAILAAVGMVSVLAAPNATARTDPPYCAVSRGFGVTYEDCGFASFAACQEEVRGMGGFCRPNARYMAPAPPPAEPPPDARRVRPRGEPRR